MTVIVRSPLSELLKELSTSAVKTWEGVTILVGSSEHPIYLFVVDVQSGNVLLQFKHPKSYLTMYGDILKYTTGETVCHKKFFNRDFLPTFFVFDNYLHAWAFEQKLSKISPVIKQKFK